MATIQTIEDDHSNNLDELLNYLSRESKSRGELAAANWRNPERAERELSMAKHYERMYKAAKFYRLQQP